MLALLLALNSFTQEQKTFQLETKTIVSNSDTKQYPIFISSDLEDKDLVYNESEKSEFEIELDFYHNYSFSNNFLDLKFKSGINSIAYNFHKSNQNLPLYDLFCKWKLHLS
tara:strand:- start:74749 stop:75081 length:333 start_codon:yes stop_codon:yes gene_type:complete